MGFLGLSRFEHIPQTISSMLDAAESQNIVIYLPVVKSAKLSPMDERGPRPS
jgi:hypothetical protein